MTANQLAIHVHVHVHSSIMYFSRKKQIMKINLWLIRVLNVILDSLSKNKNSNSPWCQFKPVRLYFCYVKLNLSRMYLSWMCSPSRIILTQFLSSTRWLGSVEALNSCQWITLNICYTKAEHSYIVHKTSLWCFWRLIPISTYLYWK